MAARDAEFAAKHGLPQRYDVQNLREAMSSPGWRPRLAQMLKAGTPLPGIMLAAPALKTLGSPAEDSQ